MKQSNTVIRTSEGQVTDILGTQNLDAIMHNLDIE